VKKDIRTVGPKISWREAAAEDRDSWYDLYLGKEEEERSQYN